MIQIREMQVRDANAVAEIERQIFSQPWSRQGFLDAVNLGNTVFLVAEENNRIIGYIGMYLAMGLYSVVCAKDFMNFQKRMPM